MQKRKRYIVQPGFQARMVFKFVFLVSSAIILTSVVTYAIYKYQSRTEHGNFFYIADDVWSDPVVTDKTRVILPAVLVTGFIGIVLSSLLGLVYSHRLAGPVYRIQNILELLINGQPVKTPVILREHDEFKELAETVNRLVHKMQGGPGGGL